MGAKIVGYGAVFYDARKPGSEYCLHDDGEMRVVERNHPACFDRAIREKDDCRALFNHDVDNVLGRSSAGTLRLRADATGLRYEIDAPNTQLARDLADSIERGDICGSSYSFDVLDETYEQVGRSLVVRTVRDARLYDVGPVTFPAFTATTATISGRSADPAPSPRPASLLPFNRYAARARVIELHQEEDRERAAAHADLLAGYRRRADEVSYRSLPPYRRFPMNDFTPGVPERADGERELRTTLPTSRQILDRKRKAIETRRAAFASMSSATRRRAAEVGLDVELDALAAQERIVSRIEKAVSR